MPLTNGTRLGPYEILGPLGAGGMGEVYKARDTRLGRDVALKVIAAGFAAQPDRLARFEQEARAAAALNHPNICAVFDVGTHEGAPFIVSELLEGETLRSVCAAGTLSPKRGIEYAAQIARGLAAAHDKGIVHRDLKPENVFITGEGRAKILDFGLAKLTQPDVGAVGFTQAATTPQLTQTGTAVGTVSYMSPEQVRGLPTDFRTDIFSFGAVLFEMVTGSQPFRGETTADTMSAILREDPPDPAADNPRVSTALARIIAHCLEKRPEDRFRSAGDLAFALEALSGASTSRSGIDAAVPAPRARLSASVAAAIAILLVVGAAVGVAIARRTRPAGPAVAPVRLSV